MLLSRLLKIEDEFNLPQRGALFPETHTIQFSFFLILILKSSKNKQGLTNNAGTFEKL